MKAFYFLITVAFLFSKNISAQTDMVTGPLRFTVDCADEDGIVDADALKTCKAFVLKGTGKEDYELISFELSMVLAGSMRIMQFTTKNYSDATAYVNTMNKGKTLYIGKIKVKNAATKKTEKLPDAKIIIK